ncbi:T-cell leukemia/lymphoma protein 1A-like [Sorex fumeus]|uniref:T-cell leukemia/lymphoma protein 1A-like n=1 Tax=Sorex fumeus TaxID=62283 RepID=UPI0024AC9FE7|nr:T-cell leukemia/lymphoma protein 1A-like [Sorex fumeus]XP_055989195.1 T-cell leukemia/lymphoma protein 1A-like [Sorex fumeus]
MGEPTTVHPDHLWIWDRAVYLDERQRTWLPTVIKVERGFRVLMRQQDVPLSHAMRPSQLGSHRLPLLWQLYPGNRYKGSDSSFWSIVYHVKFTSSEDMLLDLMPESDREANEEAAEAGPRL